MDKKKFKVYRSSENYYNKNMSSKYAERFIAYAVLIVLCLTTLPQEATAQNHDSEAIRPYTENPMYWQYKGEPVMLIGGTDTDNLFQLLYLEEHLDNLVASGGNYVRNTMAFSREEDAWPYQINDEGKFDLEPVQPGIF